MNDSPLKIGNKRAERPLIQGGMGVGISLSGLAGAVAAQGGVGMISTAQIGYREPDYDKNPLEANLRAIGFEIAKARELAHGGLIGVNIMVATRYYEKYVEAACRAGADLIVSGAGLPVELPALVRDSQTLIAPIVSSAKSASVICRYWEKKHHRVPDLVVIEGPKAGGHLGFSREQLETFTDDSYEQEILSIISIVRDYGNRYDCEIPIVVAGGIYQASQVEHLMTLDIQGVQVASRFVTTEECDAHQNFKTAYLNATENDIVIVNSPVGMPGRAIANRFLERTKQAPAEIGRCYQCIKGCSSVNIPYCISRALINAVRGDVDHGLIFCGANSFHQKEMQTVANVMQELMP